jgi:hypothetical protein
MGEQSCSASWKSMFLAEFSSSQRREVSMGSTFYPFWMIMQGFLRLCLDFFYIVINFFVFY